MAEIREKSNFSADGARLGARWLEKDESGEGSRRDVTLKILKTKCQLGGEERPRGLDLRGIVHLSKLDLTAYDMRFADLTGAVLSGTNLSWSKLSHATLLHAQIEGCDFIGADVSFANLNECRAERAGFGAANLADASLVQTNLKDATLTEAMMPRADLRAADLEGASLRHAVLENTNLTRSNLKNTDLKQSNVEGAMFNLADLTNARLLGVRNYTKATWIGADINGVDPRGAYLIRRHIWDENYLYEFKTRSKYYAVLYWVWWLTSNCGRSLFRWALFITLVILVFALLFSMVEVDYGPNKTAFSPIYYSIVTMTTLGYGDALPASMAAQVIAAAEAIVGYVCLGGLLSILSNKFARRAE